MHKLPSSQQQALRARAHTITSIVMISNKGLSDAVLREIDLNLKAHELIKIRVLNDQREDRAAMMETICAHLHAVPVQRIGKILVVYRQNPVVTESALQPVKKPKKTTPLRRRRV